MPGFIHPSAVIYDGVKIGDNVYIGAFCVIGAPPEHRNFWGNETNEGVVIRDNVRITTHVTVDAGTEKPTFISDNVVLLSKSHIGHDAVIGARTVISCGVKVGGHSEVGYDCNIGLNACIHQKVIIDHGCMIGMGAVVSKTLITEPNSKYAGVPARWIGVNKKP